MPSNIFLFLIFLLIVLLSYYLLKKTCRLLVLLIASYVFYGWWDWKFLFLLQFVIFVDYVVGRSLGKQENRQKRRILLFVSVIVDLSILFVFKYLNFFSSSLALMLKWFGIVLPPIQLNILLPMGLSFFIFKSLSYTIDIYFKRMPPENSFVRYAVSIAFFPQILAGPIMRPRDLLPQIKVDQPFNSDLIIRGLSRVIWGAFKKLVVADSLAPLVMIAFDQPKMQSSLTLCIGALFFAFQIYADFSGYSDIAIGISQMLGFKSIENFNYPYLAKSPSEFWSRWHMSLSAWLRDYLFLPIFYPLQRFFSRFVSSERAADKWGYGTATIATMFCAGLWHGAAWTFVIWGVIHGAMMAGQRLIMPPHKKRGNRKSVLRKVVSTIALSSTLAIVVLCWIIFRSTSLSAALDYLGNLFVFAQFDWHAVPGTFGVAKGAIFILVLIGCEWFARKQFVMESLAKPFSILRLVSCSAAIWMIALFGSLNGQTFIYFQF